VIKGYSLSGLNPSKDGMRPYTQVLKESEAVYKFESVIYSKIES
jgi:hypothetical protein